jgi:ectoine hydroxylase-related dioxygenase (phytanoyl-CoA dioxygenase family)
LLDAFNPISPGTLVWPIWRQVSIVLGCPHVGLAEIVVSKPGGAAQDWHFDGTGVTLQIALTDIDEEKGPTEVLPRPLASEYVSCMMDAATTIPNRLASNAFHRPRYDLTTIGLVAIWSALRPMLDVGRARFLIERIGLPPPVVRLLSSQGVATLYDSAMVHRGGLNNGLDDRPILAVHMRNDMHFGPANVTDEARWSGRDRNEHYQKRCCNKKPGASSLVTMFALQNLFVYFSYAYVFIIEGIYSYRHKSAYP